MSVEKTIPSRGRTSIMICEGAHGDGSLGLLHLLQFKCRDSVDADISLREITERFVTGGMSLGALRRTHESLAMAMNRLGAASNWRGRRR